jgi:hypothetical protein
VLVAGEETNESLSTWLRAAVHQSSESERERERDRTHALEYRVVGAAEGDAATAGPVGVVGRSESASARKGLLLGRFFYIFI